MRTFAGYALRPRHPFESMPSSRPWTPWTAKPPLGRTRETPDRAPAREPGGPRLRVDQRELARLPQGRLPRLCAVLHDDARGPVDVRVRVPVPVLQVLPDEGVVRLRVPSPEDQEALRGE